MEGVNFFIFLWLQSEDNKIYTDVYIWLDVGAGCKS